MSRKSLKLLENGSATGSAMAWPGGKGRFVALGTFGGATVKLEFMGPDNSTWLTEGSDTTVTAAGGGLFELPPCKVRANVAGGTPSALYVTVAHV